MPVFETLITGDYELKIDPEQPHILHFTDTRHGQSLTVTVEEAMNLLTLMYRSRDELQMQKDGA